MTSLSISNLKNFDVVSGIATPLSFVSYWQTEIADEKEQIITQGLIDPVEKVFSFLKSKNCEIVNEKEITDFLKIHANIINYLYESPDVILQYFGDIQLCLELFFDPEIEQGEGELFLNIRTNFTPEKAIEKLNQIDKDWLLKKVGKDIGKFNLNLEFS